MTRAGAVAGAVAGAFATRAAYRWLRARPPGGPERWARVNHRGEPVTLLEGPAVAVGAAAAAALPGLPPRLRAATAAGVLATGALGAFDDLAGNGSARGFRGHLGALARGEVTSGAVKVAGIGACGLLTGALVRDRWVDRVLAGVVVAGSANLVNLLDLRPGRAAKAAFASGVPHVLAGGPAAVVAAGALGAAGAVLPDDLGERAMLGDAGANALGAALGLTAAWQASRRGLLVRSAVLVGLTAASERVSFTRVIDSTAPLRRLDALGRRRPS